MESLVARLEAAGKGRVVPEHSKRSLCAEAAAELARLRQIIDSRPAINAGLPETYVIWSQGIYAADIAKAGGYAA